MKRREFITAVGVAATWPFAARAQQAGRIYRLGTLMGHPRDVPVNVAFLEEFRRYGFIEGQNLAVEWRAFGKNLDLIPQYAAELISARVDVIATAGEEATRAAQQATKTIPIVAIADDLLGAGLVQSLARPEGNTTGVNILAADLDGKRQDLLIEAVPGLRRLAALADVNSTAEKLETLQEAARAHNVELLTYRIARGEEIAPAIDDGARIRRYGAQHFFGCASYGPIVSSLWTAPPPCTCRRCTELPRRQRKAPLPPTDRALVGSSQR